ncbi:MAG: PIG-L family deacetylase [Planctomycetota bacterium]|jgi:LmbE family N-acetylglucosaminyl deacetylase
MMKITHFVHNFPPEFRGGTEVYLKGLCLLQKEVGHNVTVIAGSERRDWRDDFALELCDGLAVLRFFRMPQGEDYSVDFHIERFENLLLDYIERERPDVVHLHHWMNLGNEILRAAAGAGVPSVLTLHDLYPLCPRFFMTRPGGEACGPEPVPPEDCLDCMTPDYEGTLRSMEGELRIRRDCFQAEFAAVNRVVVPSKSHVIPYLKSGLLGEGGYEVLHHGLVQSVPEPVWTPNADGPLRLVTWGNLVRAKGVHTLIEALRHAHAEREGLFELHLYGQIIDDRYEEELKDGARGLPVVFHGDFSHLTPTELGRDKDLAVFPSLARESYSMVLDEAVALGLPVVVSDAGALPERAGDGGEVFPAGDAAALGKVLLDLEGERSRLEAFSQAIRKRTWTLKDNCRRLEALYREAMEEGARRVPARAHLRRSALLKGEIAMIRHEHAKQYGSFLRFSRFREFVPLRDFAEVPGKDVLVLAPHPDDEVIGCGGAIALHTDRGDRVMVVHLTDGAGGGALRNLSEIRKEEARAAGGILGVQEFLALDFPDGRLLPDAAAVERIRQIVLDHRPSVVYAPSSFEIHPDHIAALFIALHLLEHGEASFSLLLYEVNEVMVPGFLLDISSVASKKDEALACFESQIKLNDVRTKSMAGARWRTANVDLPEVTHAEAYIEANRDNLRGLIARTKELVKFIGEGPLGEG